MALKSFNVQGGLTVGTKNVFDANANLNLTSVANVDLGPVGNLHIAGGNANTGVLGTVSLNGSGNVTSIAITTIGDGYTIPPVITISGANTIPANATVSLHANGALNTITINNPGTGYSVGTVSAAVAAPSERYLQTDGAGNLSWTEVMGTGGGGGGGEPGGSNTQIQYNDNGQFNGTAGFTFDETSNAVTANGTITGTNFVGANLLNGNSQVAIASNGNITLTATSNSTMVITDTGANITGTLDVTANANVGNLGTTTAIITTGNITTVNTGLVQNGNANVAIAANGNVTLTAVGNATLTVTGTGANITGTANITNDVLAGGNVNVTANINGATFQNGNSNVRLAANSNVTISSNGQSNIVTVSSDATNGLVTVVGNITANNITTSGSAGNISGANVISANTFQTTANGAFVVVGNNGTTTQQVSIIASNSASFTSNYTLTLPVNDGSASQYLQTDGSGILSWQTVGTSGISNGTSNVSIPVANGNVDVYSNGNLTAVFTGTGANVTGTANVTGDILAGGNVNVTANINGSKFQNGNSNVGIAANGNITLTATSNATMVITDTGANITGTANVSGNANVGNLGTNTAIITTGNITTINSALLQTGNSNVALVDNGNVTITASGNSILAVTGTGANITGTLDVSGNANTGNLGTTTAIITTGNITTVNTGLVQNGNSNITITSNANIKLTANGDAIVTITSSGDANLQTTGGNVTGYWNVSGNVIGGNLVGTLANGNSNVAILTANGSVGIGSNGQANILYVTSNGTFAQSTFQNDVTITGNLTVQGNAIYSNTEVLTVEDPIISLGVGANGSILVTNDGKDRGLELHTYGNGATYTTSGSTPSGNTTIVLTSTAGIVAGQYVTSALNPNAIPVGATVATVNAGNIIISTPTTATIATTTALQIGNDTLRFMGWSNANGEFQFYSNAVNSNEVITGTLGNVNAATFIGAFQGNLTGNIINGNSSVNVAANANVTISANGNANIVTVSSSGDGNLQTTGMNVAGFITSSANITAANFMGVLANGNSNVSIPSANGNVNINAIGNTVLVVTGTGANITGTANITQDILAGGNVNVTSNINGSRFQNGNSNIVITANSNVTITSSSNATMVITDTGANITGTANVSGNANVGNLGTNTAIITTGNITTINSGLMQNGNSNITITANANVTLTANGNAVIAVTSSGDGNVQTTGANITGYLDATGNATASNVVIKSAGSLLFVTGNSNVGAASLTTTTTSANQPLAIVSAADGRAVEFIVKGIDSAGEKYITTTILALVGNAANGDCDYNYFAQLITGITPGTISVALIDSNANIALQVTPASTNSTVWTTQYRVI